MRVVVRRAFSGAATAFGWGATRCGTAATRAGAGAATALRDGRHTDGLGGGDPLRDGRHPRRLRGIDADHPGRRGGGGDAQRLARCGAHHHVLRRGRGRAGPAGFAPTRAGPSLARRAPRGAACRAGPAGSRRRWRRWPRSARAPRQRAPSWSPGAGPGGRRRGRPRRRASWRGVRPAGAVLRAQIGGGRGIDVAVAAGGRRSGIEMASTIGARTPVSSATSTPAGAPRRGSMTSAGKLRVATVTRAAACITGWGSLRAGAAAVAARIGRSAAPGLLSAVRTTGTAVAGAGSTAAISIAAGGPNGCAGGASGLAGASAVSAKSAAAAAPRALAPNAAAWRRRRSVARAMRQRPASRGAAEKPGNGPSP